MAHTLTSSEPTLISCSEETIQEHRHYTMDNQGREDEPLTMERYDLDPTRLGRWNGTKSRYVGRHRTRVRQGCDFTTLRPDVTEDGNSRTSVSTFPRTEKLKMIK